MRHSLAVKLAAVRYYLDGNAGINATAAKFRLSHTQLNHWINLYRLHGRNALAPVTGRRYPPGFKRHVVQIVLSGDRSVARVAAEFNLPSHTTVKYWVRLYSERGSDAFCRNKPEREDRMTRQPATPEPDQAMTPEEMLKELRYLRAENAYLKAMQEHLEEKKRRAQEKKRR
jgi:transposase